MMANEIKYFLKREQVKLKISGTKLGITVLDDLLEKLI